MVRPLDADYEAYELSAAPWPGDGVPVSGAVVRALVAVVLRAGGGAELADGTVRLEHADGSDALVAEPCMLPSRSAECARCGHWEAEHDHPAVVSACERYRLRIGPARFKTADHDGVTYAWVRRIGRARWVFEVGEPCEQWPGGVLSVHRYPGAGAGRARFGAHRWPVPVERRAEVLEWARSHVR